MDILYKSIDLFFYVIELLIFARIIFSFLRIGPDNPIGGIVYELTEPILAPAKRLIQKLGINMGMLDFSPIIALLILRLIANFIKRILF